MSQWTTQRGTTMPVLGQPTLMECWITCYDMMLKASGINWGADKIEKKLIDGGFSSAKECRKSGVTDEDLSKMAQALGTGSNKTSSINSLSGLKIMLQLCGPLWVAGKFEGTDGKMYKHVVMVIGVNEEGKPSVHMVNPWVQNMWDSPSKGWCSFAEFRESIKSTLNVDGSVQYLTGLQASVLALKG